MKSSSEQTLLNKLLTGPETNGFRESTLNEALAAARQVRRRRSLSKSILIAAVPVGMVVLAVLSPFPRRSNPKAGLPPATPVVGSAGETENTAVEFISDSELLALFPGRPLALVGPEGRQELVFLDQSVTQ